MTEAFAGGGAGDNISFNQDRNGGSSVEMQENHRSTVYCYLNHCLNSSGYGLPLLNNEGLLGYVKDQKN